ncbi:MAG: hypothetical protein JWN70_1713 [Planctomycetaceae bacterium]|nr:hypothetical protein [Planctomycetaceae bacterium]
MWTLGRIWIYPIKSLPGVEVARSLLLPAGNLQHDREFALVDDDGQVMNAKRTPEIHRIRANWDLVNWSVSLAEMSAVTGELSIESRYHLDHDRLALTDWFSSFFEMPLTLVQQPAGGFPDDTDSPGPTVVSTASLQTVANWFPELNSEEIRHRFRANLELDGGEPFGEDQLVPGTGQTLPFQIGEATLFGTNPCQRCVVPTRSPETGAVLSGFQKRFANRREAEFSSLSNRARFDHFYRLSVNTKVQHTQSQLIRVGDTVKVTPVPT